MIIVRSVRGLPSFFKVIAVLDGQIQTTFLAAMPVVTEKHRQVLDSINNAIQLIFSAWIGFIAPFPATPAE